MIVALVAVTRIRVYQFYSGIISNNPTVIRYSTLLWGSICSQIVTVNCCSARLLNEQHLQQQECWYDVNVHDHRFQHEERVSTSVADVVASHLGGMIAPTTAHADV